MTKRLIVLTALAGLLAAGCSSNKGGTSDQKSDQGYNTGTAENPNPDTAPDGSGGPVRGPGTGGMPAPSTQPGNTNSGATSSDTGTSPDYNTAPSNPDNGSQPPQ